MIRCRRRISETVMEYKEKHPTCLPIGHHLTNLVIEQCHKGVHHGGVRETLTELRTRFWVNHGRQAVKQSIPLFSCAVPRVIDLDITEDLATGTFLRCFRKLTARGGVPQLIISDNAKTCKSAPKELKTLYERKHRGGAAFMKGW